MYRLFLAIFPKFEQQRELLGYKEKLDNRQERIRFNNRENIHMTLVFIGEVGGSELERLKENISSDSISKFTVHFNRLQIGAAENKQARVITIAGENNPQLAALRAQVTSQIKQSNVTSFKEESSFVPHITLARLKNSMPVQKIQDADFTLQVDEFYLVLSNLTQMGPFYSKIKRYQLA
jgi:2'-5' RNA ligase